MINIKTNHYATVISVGVMSTTNEYIHLVKGEKETIKRHKKRNSKLISLKYITLINRTYANK